MRAAVDHAPARPFELSSPQIDVSIVCSDFDRSLDFYRTKLGLEVHADLAIPRHLAVPSGLAPRPFRHVRLRAGSTLIKLVDIERPPAPVPPGLNAGVRWLTFQVTDLDATIRELGARGVTFLSGRLEGLAGAFACAQAPDNVLIEFVEMYPVSK